MMKHLKFLDFKVVALLRISLPMIL